MIKAIRVGEMPPFEEFPMAHQVTYSYYLGLLKFLDEDYKSANEHLAFSLSRCHPSANKNITYVYSIPQVQSQP